MSKAETETETYYAVECRNLTDYTGWFFLSGRYEEIGKHSNVGDAKERIRIARAQNKAFGCKCQMEYRIVRMTETITKEVVE